MVGHEAVQPPAHTIPSLFPCPFLPTVSAWELGEGYSVEENVSGQGGVLTGGLLGRNYVCGDELSDPAPTDVVGTHQLVMIY
ncbi:hypothetical protein CesoFtcFv8_010882 [Champsocephalus esox]|uniref:Uncharacterized protein n=1 Tax=Champsocephalus esox TaxID=159716 RepID=A0AAN8BZU8_9TELE|nr:hypothetical protein CesoFtcFv8_010882 [Champsocephalus esox]